MKIVTKLKEVSWTLGRVVFVLLKHMIRWKEEYKLSFGKTTTYENEVQEYGKLSQILLYYKH